MPNPHRDVFRLGAVYAQYACWIRPIAASRLFCCAVKQLKEVPKHGEGRQPGEDHLRCSECKQRNYNTNKNKKNTPDRLEMNKYCPFCREAYGSQRNQVNECC